MVQSLNFEFELALNVFHRVKFDWLMVLVEELVSFGSRLSDCGGDVK
jgi:hypothetical protein